MPSLADPDQLRHIESSDGHAHTSDMDHQKKAFLWKKQQRGHDRLLRIVDGESPETVYGGRALSRAFRLNGVQHFLGCMDGRIRKKDTRDQWMSKIGIGANGRLLDELLFEKLVVQVRTIFAQKLKKDPSSLEVTYHAMCGACIKFCTEMNPKRADVGLPPINPVEAGEQIARRLMQELDIDGDPIFIPSNWLAGDEHWHPERSIAVDTTGVSRPMELGNRERGVFPYAFELSGVCYPTLEHLSKELRIAIGIALDEHHGMGDRFTTTDGDQRLLLPVFEDPTNPELVGDIGRIVDGLGQEFDDRVLPVHVPIPEQYVRNNDQD